MSTELPASPSLEHHVGRVVSVGAYEQVGWPYAQRVVAVMADEQSSGDWSEQPCVHESMNRPETTVDVDLAITVGVPSTSPDPTISFTDGAGQDPGQHVGVLAGPVRDRTFNRPSSSPAFPMRKAPPTGVVPALAPVDSTPTFVHNRPYLS